MMTASTTSETDFNKVRLNAYYRKHNPSKIDSVDETLLKFAGREDEMFEKLQNKYGEDISKCWLTEFYKEHNPDKLDQVDSTLTKYAGKEEVLYEKLEKKYGASAAAPTKANKAEEKDDASVTVAGTATTATATTQEVSNLSDRSANGGVPKQSNATGQALTRNTSLAAVTASMTAYSSGSTNKEFNKKRLIAFYGRFNPEKLNSVDEMLIKWSGREEKMFQKLETKYGDNVTKVWLTAFYTKYNPDRVGSVDQLMEKYKGNEESMFIKLTNKYNDPPAADASFVPDATAPQKEQEKEQEEPSATSVKEEVVAAAVATETAASSGSGSSSNEFNKKRLSSFYGKHNRDKMDQVDTMLKGWDGKEEAMFAKLEKKYGENPTKPWLNDFYAKHNPDKLSQVDSTLEKYKGREIELYIALTKKYGSDDDDGDGDEGKDMNDSWVVVEAPPNEELPADEPTEQTRALVPSGAEEIASLEPQAAEGPPVLQSSVELTEYQTKVLEMIEDIQQGQIELEMEYIEEYGKDWSEDPELVFKYSDMVKRMTRIKHAEVNDELGVHKIDHVIMIDQITPKPDPTYVEKPVPNLGPYGDDVDEDLSRSIDGDKENWIKNFLPAESHANTWMKYYVHTSQAS